MLPYSVSLPLRTVSQRALLSRSYQAGIILQQTRWLSQGRRPLKNLRKKNDTPGASSDGNGTNAAQQPLSKIQEEINLNATKQSSKQHRSAVPSAQEVPPTRIPGRKPDEPRKVDSQTPPPPHVPEKAPASTSDEAVEKRVHKAPQPSAASPTKVESETQTPKDTTPQAPPPGTVAKPHSDNIFYRLFASWQQGLVASIGAMMGIGFLFFLFYNPVKEDTVHHTAVVASEALNDLRLRNQAVQLSKDVVDNVLKDPKSLNLVCELVVQLLAKEDTKIAVSSLLQSLFEDHYTQEVTKKFVLTIVRDPWIQDQLHIIFKDQISNLLQDDDVKQALTKLLITSAGDGLEDPQLHIRASRAIRGWVSTAFNATLASIAVICASYVAYEIRLGRS